MKKLILLIWKPNHKSFSQQEHIMALLASKEFDVSIETGDRTVITMLENALKEGKLDSLSVYIKATDTCYDYEPDDTKYWKQMYSELR